MIDKYKILFNIMQFYLNFFLNNHLAQCSVNT